MPYIDPSISELSPEECWQLLESEELGRLAYLLGDELNLVPVNYAVDDGTLLFRTAEGNKLLGVLLHPEVVFEIDVVEESLARSVIVRGTARRLEEDEEHRADDIGLMAWVPTLKYDVVEIRPQQISGRGFVIDRSTG